MAMPRKPWKPAVAVVLLTGILRFSSSPSAEQAPSLPDLLKLAGEYHTDFSNRVSGAALEEQYQLTDVTGGKMQAITRIASDVVFVNLNGGIAALRDAFAVDTKPLRERTPRITALLARPAATVKDWETVIGFPAEGSRYFGLDITLKVNEPTMALRFIGVGVQPSLKYKLDGKKKINGIETIGIAFEEPAGQETKYILGTRSNARATGRVWVDPATGAVHQTELWVESKGESANVSVKYAVHAALNLILPSETTETYEEREAASGPRDFNRGATNSGRGGSRISFQASAKYSKPTYAPIDLRTLRK
jgi:hypothetical protein